MANGLTLQMFFRKFGTTFLIKNFTITPPNMKTQLTKEQRAYMLNLYLTINASLEHNSLVAIDKKTKKTFYYQTSENGELLTSPTESETGQWNLSDNADKYILPVFTGFEAEQWWNNSETSVEQWWNNSGTLVEHELNNSGTLAEQKSIYFNSKRIEPLISYNIEKKEIKIKAVEFEKLTKKRLKQNISRKAIITLHELYKRYINIIENSDYKSSELDKIILRLKKNLQESEVKIKTNIEKKTKSKVVRNLKNWAVSVAIFLAIVSASFIYYKGYSFSDLTAFIYSPTLPLVSTTPTKEQPWIGSTINNNQLTISNVQRKKYTSIEIKNLIQSNAHGVFVGEWRQGKIVESFAGGEYSPWEAKQLVKKGIKKKY